MSTIRASRLGREAVPFITYFPAVLVVTWFGGLGPGLLAVGLGGLAADYFFMPPLGGVRVAAAEWLARRLCGLAGVGSGWRGASQ